MPGWPKPPGPEGDLQRRTDRLQGTLEKLAEETASSGWTTALQLFNGVAYLSLGAAITFVEGEQPDPGWVRAIGATMAVVIGAPSLVMGIRGLGGRTTTDEDRLVRFRRQRSEGPLDAISVAHYEGELRTEADFSRASRVAAGWGGLGVAVGGATLIGFAAASPLFDEGRVLVYIEGGTLLVLGTILGISSFSESPNEREWRLYRDGESNTRARHVQFGVVPLLGPNSATVSVVGKF